MAISFRCVAWLLEILMLILAILCACYFVFPKDFFCVKDVLLTEIISNITIANGIQCRILGTRLGYHTNELETIADVKDLAQHWMNDQLNNGPDFSHGSMYKLLDSKEYIVNSYEIQIIHAFEVCTEMTHRFSSAAPYIGLVFLVVAGVIKIMCLPPTKTSSLWERTIHLRRDRVRTESEQTDAGSVNHNFLIKNPVFTQSCSVSIKNETTTKSKRRRRIRTQLFSCIFTDGQTESVYTVDADSDKVHTAKRLFKKEFDGTLTRSSIQLVCQSMKSVGILFVGYTAKGTVVRIGSHFIITAWHVIKDIVFPRHMTVSEPRMDRNLLAGDRIYVDFHEQTRQSPEWMRFKLTPNIVFLDDKLDIIILELDIAGKEEHVPQPFECFADVFELNTSTNKVHCVHIIGQHPREENVVADFACKVINKDDKNVKRARKWMRNNMANLKRTAIQCNQNPYDIDTAYNDVCDTQRKLIFNTFLEFGSSGGAVIALLPEDKVALVAIVTHGLPPNYWYSMNTHQFPENMRMEVGCTVKAITQSLAWKGSHDLRDEIFCQKPASKVEPMEVDPSLSSSVEGPVAMETEERYQVVTEQEQSVVTMETEQTNTNSTGRVESAL